MKIKQERLKSLEERVETLLVKATWVHKIHEKQGDIYDAHMRHLTVASLVLISFTASGVLATLISDVCVIKIITAFTSFASVFISLLMKVYDYDSMSHKQKSAAKVFLTIREDAEAILLEIRLTDFKYQHIVGEVRSLTDRYKEACCVAPPTTRKAVKKASSSLNNGESTVTEREKITMIPNYGRRRCGK